MPFFDQYPYTNFHNVNLDWILERVKEWGQMVEDNNTRFENLQEANEAFKTYVTEYLENLDVQAAIDDKIDRMFESGELTEYLQPYVSDTVTTWLDQHITEPVSVVIDTSLTVAGAAADAKTVGDKIAVIEDDIEHNIFSDEIKNSLMNLLKNIDYSSDYAQKLYNNLFYEIYGYNPPSGEAVFSYNSAIDGLLSVQPYVTYNSQGNSTQTLTDGVLTIYSRRDGLSAYTAYAFENYNGVYGSLKVLAKIHSDNLLTAGVGGSLRIEISDGSGERGAQFYIAENSNGLINIRYDIGTTTNTIDTSYNANEYHTYEVIAEGDKQSLIIDGFEFIAPCDMSTQYVTTTRIMVLSANNSQDITAYIKSVSYYDEKGNDNNIITYDNVIKISGIRKALPNANDDELLNHAILLARQVGEECSILWDNEDIRFSGMVDHECYGFKGIDFNGVNIFMPNYTGNYIISIKPDSSYDKYFNSNDFTKYRTSNSELFGKIFTMNSIREGIASMSLGKRYGSDSQDTMYSCPIIKTSTDGVYETGELFVYPQNGDVLCRNIHEYPSNRFFIRNATVNAYEGNNFTCFIECFRSNTVISDFVLKGRSRYNRDFKFGVFNLHNCCDVEFCHITGTNPITRGYDSGYAFAFLSMAFSSVHHVFLGDSNSWGCMGGRYITNCTFESCFFDRWDSHFAQFGNNVIDNCVIGRIAFGLGNGSITVKNSTFLLKDTNSSIHDVYSVFNFASHCPGGYNGDIIIDNCDFMSTLTNNEKYAVLQDCSSIYKVPADSVITPKSDVKRIINNCRVDNNCLYFIVTGTDYAEDKIFFNGYHYTISNSIVECESIVKSLTPQNAKDTTIDNCRFTAQVLEDLTCNLHISNSELSSITANTVLPNVTMIGCIVNGVQDVTNFTKYSFYGNIANDMNSVNTHS